MKPAVICLLDSTGEAQRVVAHLRNSGFEAERISVLMTREKDKEGPEVDPALDWVITVGTIDSEELGYFFAAGPLLASLSAAQEDTAAGGLHGVLRGLGISEIQADQYQADLAAGRVLVTVHADDQRGRELARQTCEAGGVTSIRLTLEE